MRSLVLAVSAALAATGCVTPVYSSAYATDPAATAAPAGPAAAPAPAAPAAATPSIAVPVYALRDPPGREVGVVEAHGRRPLATLEALAAELRKRAGELGANAVKLDSFGTRYDIVTETYTYDCGHDVTEWRTETRTQSDGKGHFSTHTVTVPTTRHVYQACTGTRRVEVGTMTLVGRAFVTSPVETP